MALVKKLESRNSERPKIHKAVNCTFFSFSEDGKVYLQLDTYGSEERAIKNKQSRSIQFSEEALSELKTILGEII